MPRSSAEAIGRQILRLFEQLVESGPAPAQRLQIGLARTLRRTALSRLGVSASKQYIAAFSAPPVQARRF